MAEEQPFVPRPFVMRVRESITSPIPNEFGMADSAAGQTCFYCGLEVHDPGVHWSEATGDIFLHAACTVDLAVCTLRDFHEIKRPESYARLRSGRGPLP